jgi:hypothetical protein
VKKAGENLWNIREDYKKIQQALASLSGSEAVIQGIGIHFDRDSQLRPPTRSLKNGQSEILLNLGRCHHVLNFNRDFPGKTVEKDVRKYTRKKQKDIENGTK